MAVSLGVEPGVPRLSRHAGQDLVCACMRLLVKETRMEGEYWEGRYQRLLLTMSTTERPCPCRVSSCGHLRRGHQLGRCT
jgi:hypothetical protein